MRGLDPRIHQKRLFEKMDCRVKPGSDDFLLRVGVRRRSIAALVS